MISVLGYYCYNSLRNGYFCSNEVFVIRFLLGFSVLGTFLANVLFPVSVQSYLTDWFKGLRYFVAGTILYKAGSHMPVYVADFGDLVGAYFNALAVIAAYHSVSGEPLSKEASMAILDESLHFYVNQNRVKQGFVGFAASGYKPEFDLTKPRIVTANKNPVNQISASRR